MGLCIPLGRSAESSVQRVLPRQPLASCLLLFSEKGWQGGKSLHLGRGLTRGLCLPCPTHGFALLGCICPVILIHPLRVSY